MLEIVNLTGPDEYFLPLSKRKNKGVYFYRINQYSEEIHQFINKYYECSRQSGVVIEGRIPNPDDKNLAYYTEMMGSKFEMNPQFICNSLKKWLPRMTDSQRNLVGESIYAYLTDMIKNGKNENMCKNAYIKFMCWLYYKFERIVNVLGNENLPKILYEGEISNYELMLVTVLAKAGCDIVLLQYKGDEAYLKVDQNSSFSKAMTVTNGRPFPSDFNLKKIREEQLNRINAEKLYGQEPKYFNCTNAWMSGDFVADIKTPGLARFYKELPSDSFYFNAFYRINGVPDKLTFTGDLFGMYQTMVNGKRKVVVINNEIPKPDNDEIAGIKRNNYQRFEQLIMDMTASIQCPQSPDLRDILKKAFIDVMLEEKTVEQNLNRFTNRAVYLLCWIKRYSGKLFGAWKHPDIGCFIYLGGCKNENEALFLKLLSKCPCDVLILCPDLNTKCCLKDKNLFEINSELSMNLNAFPENNTSIHIGTAAYHAERELDTIMYENSGIYRNKQHSAANAISLQTMYEEINVIWDEEVKYRPNFSTIDGVVNIPVVFSKISGVKNGNLNDYWSTLKRFAVSQDTTYISKAPFLTREDPNPVRAHVSEFFKNKKLQRNVIKNSPAYQYGILREEVQDFMLDKLQFLIDEKLIKGTFENGTEYSIISVALNLPKDIVRQIQKFDFTKKNPKVVYINTTEVLVSQEDAIFVAFLNLIGFDILFFAPTGYQNLERYYSKNIMEEHQIGDYIYDLHVPDLKNIKTASTVSRLMSIFKIK